ncbi:creatininase family protein [Jiangella gansuensis]|uniref:creatininase family protein n=1 Tax=Jiangella gansuensis TaxID=281473 RepID=UPI0004B4CEBF|nr:creatininase family protein [Jiangella gansuensis]
MSTVLLEHLTRDDLAAMAADTTVVVPLGSTEQHGPHLPVCTDTAIVSEIAQRAATEAAAAASAVVAPTLPFGFAHHHLPFGGTVSLGMVTYLEVLTDIGASLHASGFRRVLFLNGHGGNDAAVRAVGDRLLYERGLDLHVAGTSYWTCAADELAALDLAVDGPVPGHAGGFETSCLLAIAPGQVRLERRPPPEGAPRPLAELATTTATIRRPDIWHASAGCSDDSADADPEVGAVALQAISSAVARLIVGFHHSSTSPTPTRHGRNGS